MPALALFLFGGALGARVASAQETEAEGAASAESAPVDEYVPVWDEHRPPSRPQEYRTEDTKEFIRLTPYIGLLRFGHDLEMIGRLTRDTSVELGMRLEFDPADVLLLTFDVGFAGNMLGDALKTNVERRVDRTAVDDIEGKVIHLQFNLGLKNPELKFGPVQPILGLGFGAFYFFGYNDTEINIVDPATGNLINAPIDPPFEDTWMVHATLFLRFDVSVNDNFKVGLDCKVHFPFYAFGDQVGDLLVETFDPSRKYIIFEPTLYLSYAF